MALYYLAILYRISRKPFQLIKETLIDSELPKFLIDIHFADRLFIVNTTNCFCKHGCN